MRRKLTEPKIFETTCKRCGKPIYASARAFEHHLGRICKDCITPDEQQEILEYQATQIMKRVRNPTEVEKILKMLRIKHNPTEMSYNIYDSRNTSLLQDKSVNIRASNARQALQKYLDSIGDGHIKFYNTSDIDVVWKTTPFVERDGKKYMSGRISWWGIKPAKVNPSLSGKSLSVYEDFHKSQPTRVRKVKFNIPTEPLIKIGRLVRLEYEPEGSSRYKNVHFTHDAGDLGNRKLHSNTILATNAEGTDLYLVKEDSESPYPKFSERGILG